jgi:hypothetical protein
MTDRRVAAPVLRRVTSGPKVPRWTGRRADGTDHGTASTLFLLGYRVPPSWTTVICGTPSISGMGTAALVAGVLRADRGAILDGWDRRLNGVLSDLPE